MCSLWKSATEKTSNLHPICVTAYSLKQTDPHNCPLQYTDPHNCPLQYTDPHNCPLQFTDPHKCPLQYTNPHNCPLQYTDPHSCPLQYTDPHNCPLQFTDPHNCPLQYTDPQNCPLQYTDPHNCPLQYTDPRNCPLAFLAVLLKSLWEVFVCLFDADGIQIYCYRINKEICTPCLVTSCLCLFLQFNCSCRRQSNRNSVALFLLLPTI